LTTQARFRARARLSRDLEALRSPAHGIRLERYLVFATWRKALTPSAAPEHT
jgi:hypothetical protein